VQDLQVKPDELASPSSDIAHLACQKYSMGRINALELFAGIGGASLALKAAGVRTVAYCEKDEFRQGVLRDNMARGRVDKGPIFPDVRKLGRKDLARLGRVDMISGGFPCVGVSVAGHKEGLYGNTQSRLVHHVYRLVAELKPAYVFLENTPNIIKDSNFAALLRKMRGFGYRCAFVVKSASQAGARQRRFRWFMLCRKQGSAPFAPTATCAKLRGYFTQTGVRKLLDAAKYRRWGSRICGSFGNCVVPAQAHMALVELAAALRKAPRAEPGADDATYARVGKGCALRRLVPALAYGPTGRHVYQQARYDVAPTECPGRGFDIVPPRAKASSRQTLESVRKPVHFQCFPTARTHGACVSALPTMTSRTIQDAGNFLTAAKQLYPGGRVPRDASRLRHMVSDEYMASSFGFPKDWIRRTLESSS
jgi:site-specific DNA-cytosine methylase